MTKYYLVREDQLVMAEGAYDYDTLGEILQVWGTIDDSGDGAIFTDQGVFEIDGKKEQ